MPSSQIIAVTRCISSSIARLDHTHLEARVGDQVISVPSHLIKKMKEPESWGYPNRIQPGFVTTVRERVCFVRYWFWDGEQFVPELRTKTNSEMSDREYLYFFSFWDRKVVNAALKQILEAQ